MFCRGHKARYAPLVLQEINALGIYRHTGCYKPTVTLQQLPMADLRLREEETLLVSISVSFSFYFAPLLQVLLCHCSQFSLERGQVELDRHFGTQIFVKSSSMGESTSVPTPFLIPTYNFCWWQHTWRRATAPLCPSVSPHVHSCLEIVFCLYDGKIFIEKNSSGNCPYNPP